MKAYLLSEKNGTVQIGHRVYCLGTSEAFDADRSGLQGKPHCEVKENTWSEAREAYLRLIKP